MWGIAALVVVAIAVWLIVINGPKPTVPPPLTNPGPEKLRVLTWNLGVPRNEDLPIFAGLINSMRPDIVLLNEVTRGPLWDPWNQVADLAWMGNWSYSYYLDTSILGVFGLGGGVKMVGIISRFPMDSFNPQPERQDAVFGGNYRALEMHFSSDRRQFYVYTLRFSAWNTPNHVALCEALRDRIKDITATAGAVSDSPTILAGGDFNAGAQVAMQFEGTDPERLERLPDDILDLIEVTGLRDVGADLPLGVTTAGHEVVSNDLILVRGPYDVTAVENRMAWANPSDHDWVVTDLALTAESPDDAGVQRPLPVPALLGWETLRTLDRADEIGLSFERYPDENGLELVLETPTELWRKEVLIVDETSAAPGAWTIYTDGARRSVRHSLFANQLARSYLVFRKARRWGVMQDVTRVYLDGLAPGQRITFTWRKD